MEKYKVGYTAGAFDMFHIGHLNHLRRAKEQCEYLIVGVTTDDLVLLYKNKEAIIPYDERAAVVESIKYVDQVIPQKNMNKMKVWEKYKFDAMFIGSDWQGTDRFNEYERQFSEVGVDIVYLPYTKGISSTKTRELINKVLMDEDIYKR